MAATARLISPTDINALAQYPLPKFAAAKANALCRLAPAKVLIIGDSNNSGYSVVSSGTHSRKDATSARIAQLLTSVGLPVTDSFFAGGQGFSTVADLVAADTRLTLGAGWDSLPLTGLGGSMVANSTDASDFSILFEDAWDTVVVEYFISAAMTVQYGVAGNITTTPETGVTTKTRTYTTGTAAAVQPFVIRRDASSTTQSLSISSIRAYDSANPGVILMNAAAHGFRADSFTSTASNYSPGNRIASLAPHLTIIELGLNEYNTDVAQATYKANMQTLVTRGLTTGDVMLAVSNPPDDTTKLDWASYQAIMHELADENSIPIVDMTERLTSYANATALGLVTNGLHPNRPGIAYKAAAIAEVLRAA